MKKFFTLFLFLAFFSGILPAQNQTFNFMPGEYIEDYVEFSAYFSLTDISGKQVKQSRLAPASEVSFNLSDLPRGIYLGRFNSTETSSLQKIIIH